MGLAQQIATRWGIDYHQYIHLLKTSIRLDFRSDNLMPGRSSTSAAMFPLVINLVINSLLSIPGAVMMMINFPLGILIAFAYSMVSLAMVVLIEFGSTIINPDDFQIIGARPVSSRTYFAVKLSNLLFYVGLFTLALNLLPAAVGTFMKGSRAYYPLVHLAVAFLAAIFVTGFLAAVYGALLKLFDPERFKDLITYCQIFLSFFVFLSYQIIPRWLSHTELTGVASSPWLYLAPPTWFARMVELGIGRHSAENVYSAVLGGLAVASTYAVLLRALSLSYVEQVSRLITIRREKAPKEPAAFWRRLKTLLHRLVLPHSQERAIFYFIAHMFRSSRFVKRQFYPNIGINLAVFAINAFEHTGGDPFVTSDAEVSFSFSSWVPVITFLMITASVFSLLPYSDEHAGHWIFEVAPFAEKRRILLGIKKAVLILFYPATFVLNFLLFTYFWSWPHALGHTGYGLAAGLVFLQIYALLFPAIPFTKPVVKGRAQASVFLIVLTLPLGAISFIGLQMLTLKWQGQVAFYLLTAGMFILAALLNTLSNAVYDRRRLFAVEE